MASKWSAKVNVYAGADAGSPTLGTLADAGRQLRTNTSIPWSNQPLVIFANDTVIQSVISPFGGFFRMRSDAALALWGGYTDQDALVSLSRADAGEPSAHKIELAATSDSWLYDGSVFIDANAASTGALGNYNAQVNVAANNSTITTQVLNRVSTAEGAWIDVVGFAAQTNAFSFRISDEGGAVTLFSPFVADGATAVAYALDTSNTLANDAARLVSVKNNGTEHFLISKDGGILVGSGTVAAIGVPTAGEVLFSVQDGDGGGPNFAEIYVTTKSTNNESGHDLTCTNSTSNYEIFVELSGVTSSFKFEVSTSGLALEATFADTLRMGLHPDVAALPGSIAYLFDTVSELIDADSNLIVVKNSGAKMFSVRFNGCVAVGNGTDDFLDGNLVFAGVNPGTVNHFLHGYGVDPTDFGEWATGVSKDTITSLGHIVVDGDRVCAFDLQMMASPATVVLDLQGDDVEFKMGSIASGGIVDLHPSIADNPDALAHLLNTFVTLTDSGSRIFEAQNNTAQCFAVFADGSIKTAVPNGGTAGQWKLGVRVADTVVANTDEYVELDIGGTLYKLGTVDSV